MLTTIDLEIEYLNNANEYDYINVEVSIDVISDNDSFTHEFGTERYKDYYRTDGQPMYNKELYTESQLIAIENYLNDNWDDFERKVIKMMEY